MGILRPAQKWSHKSKFWPDLKHCVQVWVPQYKKDIKILQCPKEGKDGDGSGGEDEEQLRVSSCWVQSRGC